MAAGLILLASAAGYGLLHGWGPRPVVVAGPPDPLPTPARSPAGSACLGGDDGWDNASGTAFFWVGVDRDPRSVTAVWWPTLNDTGCRVIATEGARASADALATDIRGAPARPSGTYNCPNDVLGRVDLYFAYPGGRWERVRVHPTGCATLTARGRKPREAQLGAEFAALAPPGEWTRLLR